jgi:hypothetical protein
VFLSYDILRKVKKKKKKKKKLLVVKIGYSWSLLLEWSLRDRTVARHLNTQSKLIKAGIILLSM